MKVTSTLLFITSSHLLFAQDSWKDVYKESAWADRDRWQRANELILQLKLKPGDQVADIGCNEGYLTLKLASALAKAGKVYAIDVDQSKLDKLQSLLAKKSITNVEVIKGEHDNPHLPVNTLHSVIILDTYHEMDDPDQILQHIKSALKPGGRLVLCEPIAEERRNSARKDQERKHELGMQYAIEDLKRAGFKIIRQQDLFVDRTKEKGDTMWLIVCEK